MKRLGETGLGLAEFFLGELAFRHIAGVDDNGLNGGFIEEVGGGALHPVPGAVLCAEAILRGDGAAVFED